MAAAGCKAGAGDLAGVLALLTMDGGAGGGGERSGGGGGQKSGGGGGSESDATGSTPEACGSHEARVGTQ